MAVTILDSTITGVTSGGLPSGIITLANLSTSTRRWKNASFTKDGADGGGAYGPSDWTDHIGVFLVGIIKKIDKNL